MTNNELLVIPEVLALSLADLLPGEDICPFYGKKEVVHWMLTWTKDLSAEQRLQLRFFLPAGRRVTKILERRPT